MKNLLKTFFISTMIMLGMLFSAEKTYATHTAGMDIFYRWTADSTYEFTVIFYRNCQGFTATAPPSVSLRAKSLSISSTSNVTLPRMATSGTGVPPLQPSNMYNCTESNNLCYEEYYYRGSWTSRGRADDWIFSTQICCRPGGTKKPANIVGSPTQWIECGLNNKDFPDNIHKNWSPIWHNRRPNHPSPAPSNDTIINYLFRTLCQGNYYTLDMRTKEYQGDSLSYEMSVPQHTVGGNAAPIPYQAPWSFLNPMPITPAYPTGNLQINPVTGILAVTPGAPTGTGIYVLGLKCTEWRADTILSGGSYTLKMKEIGWVKRDMTIWIDPPSTCRRDSIHPADVTITDGCGDTTVTVTFHNGIANDPNSLVRCNTISPDGSEFRVLDYTNYVSPYDSTIRSIGVHKATWECRSGVTDEIVLHLAEGLNCQDYTILLKTGTDLDVLESECGFLEPEWNTGIITMNCPVDVNIDTNNVIGICLPAKSPKIFASSPNSTLQWFWVVNGDTAQRNGSYHDVPYIWTDTSGTYKVTVIDEYNCVGEDQIEVYFDTDTSFFFGLDPYCDKYGEQAGMPDFIVAPFPEGDGEWEWSTNIGPMGYGDTLKSPNLVEDMEYTLTYTKKPIANGVAGCESSTTFIYDRENFPPQDRLWVDLGYNQQLCMSDEDSVRISAWEDGIRKKYSPMYLQWYYDSLTIPNTKYYMDVTQPQLYKLRVTDSLGCWGEDTVRVTDDYRLGGPFVPCRISGNGQGEFTIIWPNETDQYIVNNVVSYDNGLTWNPASNGNVHVVNNITAQKFIWIQGIVNSACGYTEISISEECPDKVFPPNVITPNGDGINDVFHVKGLELFDNSKLSVYDRWGNRVYENSNYKNDWDGGKLPEGTYFYILEVDDPQETIHKGVITLLR